LKILKKGKVWHTPKSSVSGVIISYPYALYPQQDKPHIYDDDDDVQICRVRPK